MPCRFQHSCDHANFYGILTSHILNTANSIEFDIDNSQMCDMISIECQKNDDSLHANVKNIILDTIFVIHQGC